MKTDTGEVYYYNSETGESHPKFIWSGFEGAFVPLEADKSLDLDWDWELDFDDDIDSDLDPDSDLDKADLKTLRHKSRQIYE